MTVVFKLTIMSVVIIGLLVVLILTFGWFHAKRGEKPGIVNIDWEEEKKKLEALAAEKKAKRHAEMAAGASLPSEESAAGDDILLDPLEGWDDDEIRGGDGGNIDGDRG